MKITISGLPGAGKTNTARKISEKLGISIAPHSFAREGAKERGLTINELMDRAKKRKSIHKEIDKRIVQFGKENENFILVGWLAYHFIPDSIKVFLYVSPEEGARRIYKNQRPDETKYFSIEEAREKTRKRVLDSKEGFEKAYGLNFLLRKNYDIVIDTTNKSEKQVLKSLLKELKKFRKKNKIQNV